MASKLIVLILIVCIALTLAGPVTLAAGVCPFCGKGFLLPQNTSTVWGYDMVESENGGYVLADRPSRLVYTTKKCSTCGFGYLAVTTEHR